MLPAADLLCSGCDLLQPGGLLPRKLRPGRRTELLCSGRPGVLRHERLL
ncbi:MAG: hypothetical protein WBC44_23005 [Planctomycetaceae bacterium]